jgi:fumarylacetoacetate (FAA) hydrolase family protein
MRAFIIKHKGKTHRGNMLYDSSFEFPDGEKMYVGTLFFRKKDAKKYLETFKYKEFFEVVGVTIDESEKDNRVRLTTDNN